MKRNLSDKRSKRKIVAENRQLYFDNVRLRVLYTVAQAQLLVITHWRAESPHIEEGEIQNPSTEATIKFKEL